MFTIKSDEELTNILHDNLDYLLGKNMVMKVTSNRKKSNITIKDGKIYIHQFTGVICVNELNGLFNYPLTLEIYAVP